MLKNIVAVLKEADALPEHIVRLTWYVTSRDEYYAELVQIGAGLDQPGITRSADGKRRLVAPDG